MNEVGQRIVAAATLTNRGVIVSVRHYDMIHHAHIERLGKVIELSQGFVDNKGQYLSRAQA